MGQYDYSTPRRGQYDYSSLLPAVQEEVDPMLAGDPRKNRSMIPRARQSIGGTLTTTHTAGSSLQDQANDLLQKGLDLYNAEPDISSLQEYARQRSAEGDQSMIGAMAAQYAGEPFAPVQAHYLKRAAAVGEPLKAGNAGYITPQGQFVRDPTYQNDRKAETYLRMATQYSNQAQDERAANERLQMMQLIAGQKAAPGALGSGNATAIGVNAKGDTVFRSLKGGELFSYDNDANPVPHNGPVLAKASSGAATEDQSKAAAWFLQADNARKNMARALQMDPEASKIDYIEAAKTKVPMVGEDWANADRTAPRQMFVQASRSMAEALLRAATGAGVNKEEAEQKVRETVPQIGDKGETIKQKWDSYDVYMAGLKARAGRALSNVVIPTPAPMPGDDVIDLPPRR